MIGSIADVDLGAVPVAWLVAALVAWAAWGVVHHHMFWKTAGALACTGTLMTAIGLWTWIDPAVWQAVGVGGVVLAIALAPKGKRVLLGVPIVLTVTIAAALLGVGREQVHQDNVKASAAKTTSYASACALAKRYADHELVDAGRRQLERAAAMQPDGADPSTPTTTSPEPARPEPGAADRQKSSQQAFIVCGEAAAGLKELDPDFTAPPAVTPAPASTPSDRSTPLLAAFQRGVEHIVATALEPRAPPPSDPAEITLGVHGWLLLGGLALLGLIAWTTTYFWFVNRTHPPGVTLKVASGHSDRKDSADGFAAELRRDLFDERLLATDAPSTASEELTGAITESEVAGAKLIAAAVKLLRRVFSTTNTVTANVTLLQCDAILQLTDGRTGDPLDLARCGGRPPISTDPFELHPDHDRDLRIALVSRIRATALNRPGKHNLPPWLEWTQGAMLALVTATSLEQGDRS